MGGAFTERERQRSGSDWRVEPIHELDEHVLEVGVVVVGMLPDERDHLPIALGSLPVLATGLVDHSEAIVAIVHVGEQHQEVAGGLLGLVELAGADEAGGGVGRDGQLVVVSVLGPESRAAMAALTSPSCKRCAAALSARLASALASCSRSTASSLARQHFLYLLPLPQGQGSLRPGLAIVVNDLEPRRTHPLYSTLLADATFHELLLVFDRDIAIAARRGRCLLCGSVVHSAQYRRKPRGRPAGLGDEHDWRFSLCCARDGCRTRKTPPSLRFLGRKVYLAAMVVLIAIMREGATAARMRQLSGLVGVDRRTVERWREWWRDTFTASPFWQIGRAAFMPPVDQDRLPASLIERFTGRGGERLIALLRFIAPITGGDRRAR